MTDAEITAFTGSERTNYTRAFAGQQVPRIGRRQWQGTAITTGTEVVSIWTELLDPERLTAEAHLNLNAVTRYIVGQIVKAVIVARHRSPHPDGSRVRHAWPDHRHEWRVEAILGTHLTLKAVAQPELTVLLHEAKALAGKLSNLIGQIESRV